MKATDLEKNLSIFNSMIKEAANDFQRATAEEQFLEDKTQDLLHTAELDPDSLSGIDLVAVLHDIRTLRREAKKELEVSKIFADYVATNGAALNKLAEVLGKIRKITNRQPLDIYWYKTPVLGKEGHFLSRKEPEPDFVQLTLIGW